MSKIAYRRFRKPEADFPIDGWGLSMLNCLNIAISLNMSTARSSCCDELRSSRQNFRDHRVNVFIRCQVIDDARANTKSCPQFCVRQINLPARHDVFEQHEIELVARFFGSISADYVPKADRTKLDWPAQFKLRNSLDR